MRQIFLIVLNELTKDVYNYNKPALITLRNMACLIQQNLLICLDYILHNTIQSNNEDANKTRIDLQNLVLTNLHIRFKKKGDQCSYLKQNNESIIGLIKALTR